ncbi:hypothetical protein GC177_02905 [bacterium]|nr:hypothetical protein [bacterium]
MTGEFSLIVQRTTPPVDGEVPPTPINIYVVDPNGYIVAQFPGLNAGFNPGGTTPGLNSDLNGSDPFNAFFRFQNPEADIRPVRAIQGMQYDPDNDLGYVLRTYTPNYIAGNWGVREGDTTGDAIAMHPDGMSVGGTGINDGTYGCWGISNSINPATGNLYSVDFMNVWNSIPPAQRPRGVYEAGFDQYVGIPMETQVVVNPDAPADGAEVAFSGVNVSYEGERDYTQISLSANGSGQQNTSTVAVSHQ